MAVPLWLRLIALDARQGPAAFEVVLRAEKEVYETMRVRYLKRFLESPLYAAYRKEVEEAARALGEEQQQQPQDAVASAAARAIGSQDTSHVQALGRSRTELTLGRIDDLGFYVSENEGKSNTCASVSTCHLPNSQKQKQKKRNPVSLEIDMESIQAPSAISVVFGATTLDKTEEEQQARVAARSILQEVAHAANPTDLVYNEEDGI